MEEFDRFETDECFVEAVRNLERKIFPEFEKETNFSSEGINYAYFAPSWHVKTGLITENDIESLRTDKTKNC